MNRVYRIVFNAALGLWQVVGELAKNKQKSHARGLQRVIVLASLGSTSGLVYSDLPSGGSIVSGSGSISQSGNSLNIQQNSNQLISNWQSFDIGAGQSVNFIQPSQSAVALNRVLGNDASQIFGSLNANGRVFLINPNGVLFGQGASVNVGSLVASTLDISDSDFLSGHYRFSGKGGTVRNQGNLRAAEGGAIALLGGKVSNSGVIEARLGSVALAAGGKVALDFAGDGLLSVKVDEAALDALVENQGAIRADGGSVLLTADAGEALLQTVVNNSGVVQAQTLANRDGKIVLLGGFDGGTVQVAGTLDASAFDAGDGGFIETSGAHVKVADGTHITTRAENGQNGKWLIDPTDFTVAKTGGDMTGTALTNALANGDVEIQSTTGASGVNGDVNIRDTVSWGQNILTLNAQRDINIFSVMNATGTAGLFFKFNQADAGGNYFVYAPVNLASTGSFRTQSGSAGAVNNWTIITSLGSETDVTGNTGTTLQGIWGNLGGNYVLGADIDASATAGWNGGLGFTPIGGNDPGASNNPEFTGNFDGLGHVIDSLTINRPAYYNIGLFGSAFDGAIAHIGLTNASITGSTSVGGLVGRSGNLSIRNSYVSGAITGNGAVGGMVGVDIFPRGSDVLDHVWTAGSVTATSASTGAGTLSGIAGGLIGHNAKAIRYSYSTADVRGGNYVGGLVGSRLWGDIDKSYFAGTIGSNGAAGGDGTVKAPYAMGALAGSFFTADGVVSDSYWNTDTAGTVGVGRIDHDGVFNGVGLTTAQMRNAANWAGFDFVTTPGQTGWLWTDGAMPLLASEWSSYIRNAHQLQLMALDLSADYTLANDIDASATNGKDIWLGGSFASVGNNATPFTGQLDGQGHTIDGLHILRGSNNYVGLFGSIENATLQDFNLTNATIEGFNYVGALAGYAMRSHINNVSASGTVTGNQYVGGMVGYGAEVQIDNASSAGSVSGDTVVGGLAGQVAGASTISNSQSSASSSATGVGTVGGLVGLNQGTVADSSATGTVQGTNFIGGLIGNNAGTVRDSHATGNVGGTAVLGGLVGLHNGGSIDNSYAEGDVSGQDKIGGLVGESFNAISGSHAAGDVTATNLLAGGLVGMATSASATISNSYASGKVSANIGYAGGLVGQSSGAAIIGSHATGTVTANSSLGGLVGSTDADVTNSYATGDVNGVGQNTGGLVGLASAGIISNSHATGNVAGGDYVGGLLGRGDAAISNSYAQGTVTANGATGYVGGLAGYTSAAISGSHATGNVTYTSIGDYVGGLAGRANAAITSSYASGDVSGVSSVGGLAGGTSGSNVSHSYASGNVTGSGNYVGGLLGLATNGSAIGNSYATGEVSGASVVGGLAGLVVGGNVSHSHASGNVTGSGERVGGLLGIANGSAIGNSYATGNASGGQYVGGLVGLTSESNISNSYATGNATSTGDDAGGLVGDNGSTSISNSYASGDVSGVSRVGGLVGNNTKPSDSFSSDITNSYANGRVTGSGSDIGGLVGKNYQYHPHYMVWYDAGTITGSFWNTETTGQSSSAGGGTGITTAQMQQLSTFVDAGWDISDQGDDGKVWRIYEGSTTPLLRSFMQGVTLDTSITGGNKTYDGQVASGNVSYSSAGPIDSSQIHGNLNYVSNSANAGAYSLGTGNLSFSDTLYSGQLGYDISYSGNPSLNIAKADATVTANSRTVTYNGAVQSVTGYSVDGLVNGEDASVLDSLVEAGGSGRNAGSYTHSLSGSDNNYNLSFVDGSLTIEQAALTVSTTDVTKTYDGSTSANGSAIVTGGTLYGSDSLSGGDFAFLDKNAGTGKTVTVSGVTVNDGNGGGNYVISYTDNTGSTITKAALTVTASDDSKPRDAYPYAGGSGVTYSGFITGEDASVLAGTLSYGGSAQGATNEGNYVISVTGFSSDNYSIEYVDGVLNIHAGQMTAQLLDAYLTALSAQAAAKQDDKMLSIQPIIELALVGDGIRAGLPLLALPSEPQPSTPEQMAANLQRVLPPKGSLLFDINDANLAKEQTNTLLKTLVAYLTQHPDARVRVVGYADDRGSAAYNDALSLRRAEAVQSLLLQLGVNPDQMEVEGAGFRDPLLSNASAQGRARNRRVDLLLP